MINFQSCAHKFLLTISLVLLLPITSAAASSTCTCDEAEAQEHKTTEALKYKLVAIVSILIASAAGVSLPFLVKKVSYLSPDKDVFFLIKAFAAGVILATGFIHILPDAFESLTSPCLSENPWHKFPFTGFIAMMSSIGTLMMEAYATGYHKRTELRKAQPFDGHEESDHDQQGVHAGHVHGSSFVPEPTNSSDLIRNRIISQYHSITHSRYGTWAMVTEKKKKEQNKDSFLKRLFVGFGVGNCDSLSDHWNIFRSFRKGKYNKASGSST